MDFPAADSNSHSDSQPWFARATLSPHYAFTSNSTHLSPQQRATKEDRDGEKALHDAFDLLDSDRDGKLTRAEYHAGFNIIHIAAVTSTRLTLNGKVLADRHY